MKTTFTLFFQFRRNVFNALAINRSAYCSVLIFTLLLLGENLVCLGKHKDKPKLTIFYSDNCGYCKKMHSAFEQNKEFIESMNGQYDVQEVEIHSTNGRPIARKWNVTAVPTLIIENTNGQVKQINGFSTLEKLSNTLFDINTKPTLSKDYTNSSSKVAFAICGNSIREEGEQCDDGRLFSGDGCSSTCQIESGYSCSGAPSVCSAGCGDGITTGTEQCDDGNFNNNDGCTNYCQSDSDGDGIGNLIDNCPDNANPTQTDTDGDGIGDACDTCPTFVGNILYVNSVAGGTNNGSSWTNAFTNLQTALTFARANTCITEIWVAAGTHKPHATDRNISFSMLPNVKIYGGFPNTGNPTMANRNWRANPTILSGDLNGDDVVTGSGATLSITGNGENSYHVISNSNNGLTPTNSLLDGFTIKGGSATGLSFPNNAGGGIFNSSSSPNLSNVIFTGNSAIIGGGIYNNYQSSPVISNVVFSWNNATNDGGGVYNANQSSPLLSNVTFSGNNADSGGGMWNFTNSAPSLNNVTFLRNYAAIGGGIWNYDNSSPSLSNVTFWGNAATSNGGGIWNQLSSNVSIKNCIFGDNTKAGISSTVGADIENDGSNSTVSHTLLQSAINNYTLGFTLGSGNLFTQNPQFANTADPDGVDNIFGTADDGLMLTLCSPALNVGDNAANTNTTDLAGNPRIFGTTIDLGAYELQTAPLSLSIVTPLADSYCKNSPSIPLEGSPSGGRFALNASANVITRLDPSSLNAGSYNILYNYSVGNCFREVSKIVTIQALPTPNVTVNSNLCVGTTLNFNSVAGMSVYSWTGPNSFSSTLQNPSINSVSTLATGTYQLTVTDANGCTAMATASVVVNALPTVTASSNSPICAGTMLNLSASGGTSYAWNGVNSFSSTLQNPSITSATTSATGTYQVTVSDANGCTATATTSVVVNALPTATASSNSPICSGTTLNLSASGGTSYAWNGVSSFSSTLQNPSISSATTSATGTYQVTVTNANGCTAMATTSVVVNALPTATASSNSPICSGTTLNLSASGGTSYAWTGVNSFSSTLQNPSITSATTSATGTYQVTVSDANGCTATATTSVVVNALPTATASSNSPICSGTTLNLSASGGTSYAWSGVNSFGSTEQNPSISSATTLATGTYQVKITDVNGCTTMATTSVIVNALPTATTSSNSPICSGMMLNLSASGGTSYAWTGVNSFSSTLQNPSITSATTLATGTYQVKITDANGCTAMATTSVIVNALPTATISSNSPICSGTTLNISASGGVSYAWNGVNSFGSTEQNPSISSVSSLATGTYQVVVTNDAGCTAIATTSVVVNALPTATTSSNSPICSGTTLNLSASGGTSYAWTGVNSFSSTLQNPSITSATTLATGTYQVKITDANGCTAMATTSVIVNALPTATTSSNSPICSGTTLNLSASGGTSYAWNGVNSFSSTLQNPSISSVSSLATGTYQVVVTDANGCTAMATTSVVVNALPTAMASSNSPICSGTTLNLSASGGVSYAWTGVNSFSSTLQNPSITSATTLATGSYQVIVTNALGCTVVATISATVNPTPVTPTTQTNTQIIFGGSVTLTATGCSGTNDVLKWYQSADNVLVTMPVSPTLTSYYYAKCETDLNGITCISPQSTDVTVTVLSPTPPLATGGTTCISSPLSLTATGCSGSTGTFELKWYQNSDNTLVTMPVSPSVTTDYYAKCEQTFNSITAVSDKSNVVTLTVLNPAIPMATGATIYKGNSTSLTATGCSGEGFVVKWYETTTNTLVTMPVSPSITTQYYAKCEQTANSVTCTSSKSNDVTVTVVNRIFVDITKASAPIQNGNSWATAYGNLQTGLGTATAGVEVWVAKGTYKTTTTLDRTISFNIPNNVIVYGGFAGTENVLSERNFTTNVSTLSGEIGNQGIITDNSYHVVIFSGSSSNTRLDGFIITGGNANFDPKRVGALPAVTPTSSNIETGGGILVQNGASPVITNCSIISNSAVFGGGIYATDASLPQLSACKIMGNEATFGSGVYFQNGSHAAINNTLIAGNRGMGGLYNNNSNPTITNTTLSGNGGYNGGIFNANSQPVVKNSIIWGNSTPFNDTQSTITNSIIQGGYAGTGNLNYDPQFVNQAPEGISPNLNGDYHLKASSLGIDRGENGYISLTDLDLDGNLRRFDGGRVDLGAYEFQANGTSSVVISIASGNWESNSTWDINRVPQIGDIVIIDQNHIVTLNSQGNAKNIEYRGNGQLKLNSTNSKLNIGF